jgi:dTDP-4-amino-4,6-dideoxygalactose transaminase
MRVPFVDLKRTNDSLRQRFHEALDAAILSSAFVGGSPLTTFESAFARYCGTKYAVGMSSGTSALRLALLACGVKAGDEIITVPNTFIATVEAISQTGARPVFVDIDPQTGNMDMRLLRSAITKRTRVILPVHLYGNPCDIETLLNVIRNDMLVVIEDACQAHGAEQLINGVWIKTGSQGAAGCFSFYPTKNLGALGEGGMVVTDSSEMAERVKMLRDHGQREKNVHETEGSNERLHSIQAAVLNIKLELLDQWNQERRMLARKYDELLAGLPISLPEPGRDVRRVYHLYVIRTAKRDALKSFLSSKGVDTAIHYPTPVHLQPAYSYLGHKRGDFPLGERWADDVLSLPMFVGLREHEMEYVANMMRTFFNARF